MMNRISKACIAITIAAVAYAVLSQHNDYAADINEGISESAMLSIRAKLGDNASNIEIAREYITNKDFYDAQ